MHIDVAAISAALLQVVIAGLILGAGLPALFAFGTRLLAGTEEHPEVSSRARAGAWICFALCAVAAVFGIVIIVFGKVIFGA